MVHPIHQEPPLAPTRHKRLDDTNQLDDHLVSAITFLGPSPSGFQQACINALMLRLQNMQLAMPPVRLLGLWLLLPAVLIAAATAGFDYRRRERPIDDGSLTISLPSALRDRINKIAEAETA